MPAKYILKSRTHTLRRKNVTGLVGGRQLNIFSSQEKSNFQTFRSEEISTLMCFNWLR